MFDYHIHTYLCKHAKGAICEYVEEAIKKGFKEICFTDHIPLPDNIDILNRMKLSEADSYFDQIEIVKNKYPEISILIGIEADYLEGYERYLENFILSYPFDLIIMSVHMLNMNLERKNFLIYDFVNKSKDEIFVNYSDTIYNEYFNLIIKGVKTGLFDIVGHLDWIKHPDNGLLNSKLHLIDSIIDLVYRQKMSVEINTSGIRKKIKDYYPSLNIIEKLIKKEIPLTIGSDSHLPEHIGYYFNETFDKLSNFRKIKWARYSRRELHFWDLN